MKWYFFFYSIFDDVYTAYINDVFYYFNFFRYIEKIFQQLEEFRAFELLRSGLDRSKYLLVKEAKIIAMTCTHAALKRKELVDLGKCNFSFQKICSFSQLMK